MRPPCVDLRRRAVLVALAERTGLGLGPTLGIAADAELVRPLGASRRENRPQPTQLVDADLWRAPRAQEREGGRSAPRSGSAGGGGGGGVGGLGLPPAEATKGSIMSIGRGKTTVVF